jgi:Ca-activated chloride channel homolog
MKPSRDSALCLIRPLFVASIAFILACLALQTVFAQGAAIPYEQIRGPLVIMQDESGRNVPLAPEFTRYNVIITDGFAEAKVTQVYVNRFGAVKDMAYVFPLPHDGAVHGMRMQYKDSLYVARILEKSEAQRRYDSLVQSGGQAALLLQSRPNVFEQRIASLKRGDTATVEIEVSMPLKYVDGVFEFTMPTMVAERYGEGVPSSEMGWNPPADRSGQSLQFNVVLQTGYAVTSISSPSHQIDVQPFVDAKPLLDARAMLIEGARLTLPHNDVITLKTLEAYPNKDFILRFKRAQSENDFSVATHWLSEEQGGFFAFSLYPNPEILEGTRPKIELVLLVDISGSQSGWPLEKEKAIAHALLNKLESTDRVAVLAFSDNIYHAFPTEKVVTASSSNLQAAKTFIDRLSVEGSTQLLAAVNATLAVPQTSEHTRYYVFLTDGFITNEDAVIAAIRNHPSRPTVFTFGAGNNLNRHFLETSAAVGNGFATELISTESVTPKVDAAWERIESPQLTDLSLSYGAAQTSEVLAPVVKRLYKGLPYQVYGRYARGGEFEFVLNANRQGAPVTIKRKVILDAAGNISRVVPKLWARTQIGLLRIDEGTTQKNKARIISLSVEHQVLSDYTAFLAEKPQAVTTDNNLNNGLPVDLREKVLRRLAPFSLTPWGNGYALTLAAGEVLLRIDIVDAAGRPVKTWRGRASDAISYWVWDGHGDRGLALNAGRYLMRITTSRGTYTQNLNLHR